MLRMRLKAIWMGADFRCSERTNYNIFLQQFPGELRMNEAFLFVSKSGNQLVWLLNQQSIDGKMGTAEVTDSRRWRLTGGTWSPMMVANYAKEVGIELIGIKTFEQRYNESRALKKSLLPRYGERNTKKLKCKD